MVLTVLLGNYYKYLSPSAVVWFDTFFSAVFLGNLPFFMNKVATTAVYFVLYFVQTIRNRLILNVRFINWMLVCKTTTKDECSYDVPVMAEVEKHWGCQ